MTNDNTALANEELRPIQDWENSKVSSATLGGIREPLELFKLADASVT